MLFRMEIHHKVNKRPLQPRTQSLIKGKPGARHLGSPLEIKNVQILGQLPMGLGGIAELRGSSLLAQFHVVILGMSYRHTGMGYIGNGQEHLIQLRFD
ncbi:hypothetical protein D3C71_1750820 [compost metagenome]